MALRHAITALELDDLRAKYEEIFRLRAAQHAPGEPPPRAAMAALSRKYPGALREIDDLPDDEIRRRIEALRAASEDHAPQASWMQASSLFHASARGALSAKRWLAGRKEVDDALRKAFLCAAEDLHDAVDALAWADDLDGVARPPGGHLTDLVLARVARHLGVHDADARNLVFGVARRTRHRA